MERQIAECTTYKELAQAMIDLIRFYRQLDYDFMDDIMGLADDAQTRIDSWELEPDGKD